MSQEIEVIDGWVYFPKEFEEVLRRIFAEPKPRPDKIIAARKWYLDECRIRLGEKCEHRLFNEELFVFQIYSSCPFYKLTQRIKETNRPG